MKQKLALGQQEFSEVIGNNCIYVDKTETIYKLVNSGKYFFLSRPRRFGKSLLANTMKELFLGNKKLFKALWIEDKWDWEQTYPVIKISFSNIDYVKLGLEQSIDLQLNELAKSYDIHLKMNSNATKFKELIETLAEKAQVAIIVDEYDKPIIDYMDNIPQAEENRDILKNFYSILKDADKYIKFLFITGVSKFSQVSIFSDLNNLIDITLNAKYAQIVGWTKEEIENFFPNYLKEVSEKYKDIFPDIMQEIKKWYNGYSWDGKTRVYNPVSVMNFFEQGIFKNYWFATGTPTFLMKLVEKEQKIAFDIEKVYISTEMLDKYDFNNIHFESLLFQTGYLTIKKYDEIYDEITLGYPNKEVEKSFTTHILSTLTKVRLNETDTLLHKIRRNFLANKIEDFIGNVNILFKGISYNLAERKESYYHSLFYMIMRILGFNIEVEIEEINARIDAVIKTQTHIYIVEFKIDQSAQEAIKQIKDKQYALKYADNKRPIILIGINFDTQKKVIEDYIIEKFQ